MKEIVFEAAGISTSLRLKDNDLFHKLNETYRNFESKRPADINIEVEFVKDDIQIKNFLIDNGLLPFGASFYDGKLAVTSEQYAGFLNLSSHNGKVVVSSLYILESLGNFVRNVYSFLITQGGGLILHASGVIKEDMAYVFFGPSGSGKSTVARLSDPHSVLSDDIVVIKRVNGSCSVFPTPYWGDMKAARCINGHFKIKGMFKLIKDKAAYLKRISQSQAIAESLIFPAMSDDLQSARRLLDVSCEVFSDVPCYEMHFLPDATFWRCIDEEFSDRPSN